VIGEPDVHAAYQRAVNGHRSKLAPRDVTGRDPEATAARSRRDQNVNRNPSCPVSGVCRALSFP
jgi:hypothetical protein